MKASGVAEQYVRLLQDIYDNSMIVLRCVRVMDDFKWRWECINDQPGAACLIW